MIRPFRHAWRLRILGTVALGLALAMVLGASAAVGFSCAPRDPRAAPTEATQGRWIVVEGAIEAESFFGIRFRVDRAYAGETARTITLPGQWNANRVGQSSTFYVQRNPLAYDYTDCGVAIRACSRQKSAVSSVLVRLRDPTSKVSG